MRRLGPLLGAAFLLTTLVLLYGVRRFTRVLVSGHSMEPTLRDGDWLLVDVLNPVTAGDLAVAWDPRQTDRLIVKRVREAGTDTDLVLESDHPAHAGEQIGPVAPGSVVGVARLIYWPPRRIGRL